MWPAAAYPISDGQRNSTANSLKLWSRRKSVNTCGRSHNLADNAFDVSNNLSIVDNNFKNMLPHTVNSVHFQKGFLLHSRLTWEYRSITEFSLIEKMNESKEIDSMELNVTSKVFFRLMGELFPFRFQFASSIIQLYEFLWPFSTIMFVRLIALIEI